MADKSLIEWCDATINPAYGCTKCSPACDHCYAERMAALRFVSVEPMLGPVDLRNWLEIARRKGSGHWERSGFKPELSWVICGAETGRDKLKMENRWARDLLDKCRAAGVPFFFKKDSLGNHFLDGKTWEEVPNA